ncbi:MAG: YceI family protein [Henriciella sp.]
MKLKSFLAAAIFSLTPALHAETSREDVASGLYSLDKTHAFLTWTVKHNNISDYSVNFTDFDAILEFDADNPANSKIELTINPMGLETKYPDASKKADWENKLATDDSFFDATQYPEISFVSTDIQVDGDTVGRVTGDLSFRGMQQRVTMDVSYGGVANPPWFGQRDVIGFNASTSLDRSDFGMTNLRGIVSDQVIIEFSGEFIQDE